MKKSFLIFLILTICSSIAVNAQFFEVYIYQNREHIPLQDNVAYLENVPFEIVVYMSDAMGVLVSASSNSASYDMAMKNRPLEQIPNFCPGCSAAEENFNTRKEIYLSDEGNSYWHYANANDHRFDDIVPYEEGGFHAYRRIENINSDQEYINVREIGPKMVYLVFLLSEWNDDYTKQTEILKQPIVLAFR